MAKKISKHSRAARRNEVDDSEVKSLKSLPRAENTDTTSAIIRLTAKKNEDLLNNKITKSQTKKQLNKKKLLQSSVINKNKLERAISLSERLQGKIEKSKSRAKQVQNTRKANWDQINTITNQTLTSTTITTAVTTTTDDKEEMDIEQDILEEPDSDADPDAPQQPQSNVFALLDEVEA